MNKIDFLWLRLNALVPEPQCATFDDDFDRIVWNDERPQPTLTQLLAIDPQPLIAKLESQRLAQATAASEYKTLTVLAAKTDAEISTWANNNITDLASAKAAITILARAIGALARDRGL